MSCVAIGNTNESGIASLKLGDSAQLWKMLGPSLYTYRPLFAITVRELLQNSIDAQRQKGVDVPIEFIVEKNEDGDVIFTCNDKGIGMTEDDILNRFLALGSTGKANTNSVGGFGIAKASIIGACSSWSITTQDNYLETKMLGKESIKKTDSYYDGCSISLKYDSDEKFESVKLAYSYLFNALPFLMTSDIDINLTVKANDEVYKFQYPAYKAPEEKIVAIKTTDSYVATVTLAPMVIGKYRTCELGNCYSYESSNSVDGQYVYRLNGLTQFLKKASWDDCGFNAVVDVEANVTPDNSNYPFNASRESVINELSSWVNDTIKTYFDNVVTTKKTLDKIDSKKFFKYSILDGTDNFDKIFIEEKKDQEAIEEAFEKNKENSPVPISEEIQAQISKEEENLVVEENRFVNIEPAAVDNNPRVSNEVKIPLDKTPKPPVMSNLEERKASPYNVKVCIKHDVKDDIKHIAKHKYIKILRTWSELIEMVVQACVEKYPNIAKKFSVGFVFQKDTNAERYKETWNSEVFYLINPSDIKIGKPNESVLMMLRRAAHEVAHSKYGDHGEKFTVLAENLFDDTLKKWSFKSLTRLAKYLRTGK